MQLALAHDYLTQTGGAERVVLEFTRRYTASPLFTSVYEPAQTFPEFSTVPVKTTWLQRIKPLRRDPRSALPILPLAWSSLDPVAADVVLASSTGFAHGIPVEPGCKKVIYCHNPARWLYQPEDYLRTGLQKRVMSQLRKRLYTWDQKAAGSADIYIANSTTVARRIYDAYGIEARIVHPPVLVRTDGPRQPPEGVEPGFWLAIARGRGYKNLEVVARAIRRLPGHKLVVAGPGSESLSGDGVLGLGRVPEEQLRWLYSNARALVSVAMEDFGLTPIEANAFGTPVAVLRWGGFLDTTAEGLSGAFIEAPTAEAVMATLEAFPSFTRQTVLANAERFSTGKFLASIQEIVTTS